MAVVCCVCCLVACGTSANGGSSRPPGEDAGAGGDVAASGNGGSAGSEPVAGAPSSSGAGGDTPAGPTVAEFMGLNGFIDDDPTVLAAVGNVREYHNWAWNDGNNVPGYTGYPSSKLQFSVFDGFWDFDGYYAQLKAAKVLVFPCIEGSVQYLDNSAMPPVAKGADATDPASYVAHAAFMYQYAARYGATPVDAKQLTLDAGQKVASGLKLLPYYEDGNEPDANWVHADGSFLFTPEATAAMASADYDGHQGKLTGNFGVKTADPQAKMVLAGLAGAGKADFVSNVTSYLDGMRAWSAANRGGSFPADVINIHDYCFGPDPFGTANPKPGLSPEACKLQDLMSSIVAYRDKNLPGKELWLTEFGYDTHPKSRLRAPAIGSTSAGVVQGQWLVRSFLSLLASGIDRAFMYISRDQCTGDDNVCPNNAIQFATSGILSQKGEEIPKPAYYFLAAFKARLGAMRYLGKLDSGALNVSIARFYDAASDHGAYVLWSPTSNGNIVKAYPLSVATGVTQATLITLADQSLTGKQQTLTAAKGALTLDVSETPSIVLVSGQPK